MGINSIRIKNLKSLADTGCIEIKPLTILVGKNSSGKSAFARSFPLMRQSLERELRGPILWWGRLVDFGDYSVAINRDSSLNQISMIFNLSVISKPSLIDNINAISELLGKNKRYNINNRSKQINVNIEIAISNDSPSDYSSKLIFNINDIKVEIEIDKHGLVTQINTNNYNWDDSTGQVIFGQQNNLIPDFKFFTVLKVGNKESLAINDIFKQKLIDHIKITKGFLLDESEYQNLINLPLETSKNKFEEHCIHALGKKHNDHSIEFIDTLYSIWILCKLNVILELIRSELIEFYKNIVYLEPLRFNSQRYYRQQSIAIEEMDSRGENIAMFLKSLSPEDMVKFQEWTKKNLGFKIWADNLTGHVSLLISYLKDNEKVNVTDVGFGISQILPIIMQLWAAKFLMFKKDTDKNRICKTLVIEQPELHLHPKLQAQMADVFVNSIKLEGDGKKLNLILETHSQPLINRIGELIYEKKFNKDDVQIILFEKDDNSNTSSIRISNFNEQGVLVDWPYDFFDTSVED